jgi:inosine-uridine nucleoside N-ribohydrolase
MKLSHLLLVGFIVLAAISVGVSAANKKPVIIDTDANIDDAMALLWLLKRTDIDIKAITVVGTGWASLGSGVTNVFNLLAFMGREDIPVSWGGAWALREISSGQFGCTYSKTVPLTPSKQWSDSLVGLAHCLPKSGPGRYYNAQAAEAVEVMAQALNSTRDKVDILVLGPATNVAQLFSQNPWTKSKVGRVVFSGGAVRDPGNIFFNVPNTFAEYNAYGDPDALDAIIRTPGVNTVLVPVDATAPLIVTEQFLQTLGLNQFTSEATWTFGLLTQLRTLFGPAFAGFSIWDVFAAQVLVDQNRYSDQVSNLKITTVTADGNAAEVGRTKEDNQRGTRIPVVLKAKADRAYSDFIADLAAEQGASTYPRCVSLGQGAWYAYGA